MKTTTRIGALMTAIAITAAGCGSDSAPSAEEPAADPTPTTEQAGPDTTDDDESVAAEDVTADGSTTGDAAACDGEIDEPVTVTAWNHAGQGNEQDLMTEQIADFNAGPGAELGVTVAVEFLPDGTYVETVQSAAATGDLPDALDFDGPFLYNYAWADNLIPIDSCVPDDVERNLLPSILAQGTYDGELYSVGTFESGLGIYASRSVLEENDIRIPTSPRDAWSAQEFDEILRTLQAAGFEHPLDIKWYYGGGATAEWYTYGFSPVIQSAGADLIDRSDYRSADGIVNSPEAVAALELFQQWAEDGLIDLESTDDLPFQEGTVPLSWVGHWLYGPYEEALGDDLVVVPLPDFGEGSVTGQGSWNWGISSTAEEPDAVWAFYEFLLSDEQQLRWSSTIGAPPATQSAAASSELFGPGGDLEIYIDQLSTSSVARPQTPAYPAITESFGAAFANILLGADVQSELDRVADEIEQDLVANDFYPATN
ncbi:sugar ABC transporter substrate-binding protein [Euzebya tangerina]|uniref:sugar ABC transporter substrate-binding protein n=1 Tax=Euzebya tangerina TaxID=591198 RepID=UPI000E31F6AA|nr:extracellular solute-binding protein [Euzebya tangerina]